MGASERYHKKTIRNYMLAVNRNTEPEIIEWLDNKDNVNGYLKNLIREDMVEDTEKDVDEKK